MDETPVVIDRLENIANQLGVKRRTVNKWQEKHKWPLDRQDGRYTFYKIPVAFIQKKQQELRKISEQKQPSKNDTRNDPRPFQEPIQDPAPRSENDFENKTAGSEKTKPAMESLIATIESQQKQLVEQAEQIQSLNHQLANAHSKIKLYKEEPDFKNVLQDFENRLLAQLKPGQKPWWRVW